MNKRYIGLPVGGWAERTWYLVEVAFSADNVIHRAMFFTGFLNGRGNNPGGYNSLVSVDGEYEERAELKDAHYLVVIKKLFSEDDLNTNRDKTGTPRMIREV